MLTPGQIARSQAPSRTRMEMPAHLAAMMNPKASVAEYKTRKVDWNEKRKRVVVNWEAVEFSLNQLERYNANQAQRRKRMSATEARLNRYDMAGYFLPRLAKEMSVCMPDMVGPTRVHDIVRKRSVAMWIIRKRFGLSTLMVGKLFGNRDHATVIHALKKVEADDILKAYAESITAKMDEASDG